MNKLLGLAAGAAVVLLYLPWQLEPHIRYDDFNFLIKSRTWADAFANLWLPMNDHAMPLSRLAAAVLMSLVPGPASIPQAAQAQGLLAVIAGMWGIYLFVRRELGHPFYGLIAMAAWGVTTAYYECVTWYSASFFTLSLDLSIAALLAAQSFQRSGRGLALVVCAAFCALAPGFYAGGLLTGFFCAVYLVWNPGQVTRSPGPVTRSPGPSGPGSRRRSLTSLLPIVGTLAFLSVSLPRTADRIIHAEHYQGKTVFAAFDLRLGMENTVRTLADNQVIGAVGVFDKTAVFSWPVVIAIVAAEAALAALCWWIAPRRCLLLLGLALILASDLVVYSARADWNYARTVHNWTRYHLFPHFGLVLFVAGVLPWFEGRWWRLRPDGALSARQAIAVVVLIAGLFASNWPRTRVTHVRVPEQLAMLKRVEAIDDRCRDARMSAATAREAMGFLAAPLGYAEDNVWDLLRCSSSPVEMSVDEARRTLYAASGSNNVR
jgi:hypothetical protein